MDGIAKNGGGAAWKFRCRQSLKRMGKWTVNRISSLSRLLGSHAGGDFGIWIYHRVPPRPPDAPAPTWNVTPTALRGQLKGLLARGYRAWPLRKVLDFNRQGRPIPPRTFVVTFDDGYENNYSQAWPVLRELEVPATIFVATAYLDGVAPFPFDDWPAVGSPETHDPAACTGWIDEQAKPAHTAVRNFPASPARIRSNLAHSGRGELFGWWHDRPLG